MRGWTKPRAWACRAWRGKGDRELGPGARPVDRVDDDRVSDLGQIDADLVGPAGLEPAGHLAGNLAEALDDLEVSHGGKTLGKDAGNPVAAVAAIGNQGHIDPARGGQEHPLDDRQVVPLNGVGAKHGLEKAEATGGRDQQDHARGVLIQPMDDSEVRPIEPVLAGQVAPGPFE